MNLDVAINGRTWDVTVEEEAGGLAVVVNGRRRLLDASWVDADTLSLIDGSEAHEVRVHRRDRAGLLMGIDGTLVEVAVSRQTDRRAPGAAPPLPRPTELSGVVTTPMPGRVVRVLVAVGDRVAARQGVVVVEAMKMENELRAAKEGVVREVRVESGMAVDAGTVLVVVE